MPKAFTKPNAPVGSRFWTAFGNGYTLEAHSFKVRAPKLESKNWPFRFATDPSRLKRLACGRVVSFRKQANGYRDCQRPIRARVGFSYLWKFDRRYLLSEGSVPGSVGMKLLATVT